jgi:hypothetical protein
MLWADLIDIFVAQLMTFFFDIIRSLLGLGAAAGGG